MIFDKRRIKWFFQKITKGYSDADLWCLNYHLAKLINKRLKAFRVGQVGHPCNLTAEGWREILDEMIWAFDYIIKDDDFGWKPSGDKDEERFDNGMKLFCEYFRGLWD